MCKCFVCLLDALGINGWFLPSASCGKVLDSVSCNEHDNDLYCGPCLRQNFGSQGCVRCVTGSALNTAAGDWIRTTSTEANMCALLIMCDDILLTLWHNFYLIVLISLLGYSPAALSLLPRHCPGTRISGLLWH